MCSNTHTHDLAPKGSVCSPYVKYVFAMTSERMIIGLHSLSVPFSKGILLGYPHHRSVPLYGVAVLLFTFLGTSHRKMTANYHPNVRPSQPLLSLHRTPDSKTLFLCCLSLPAFGLGPMVPCIYCPCDRVHCGGTTPLLTYSVADQVGGPSGTHTVRDMFGLG